jgi:hypothetical protein
VLSCGDRLESHLGVGGGDGQVQDEFDVVRGQELVDCERADAFVVVGDRLGAGSVEVGDGHEDNEVVLLKSAEAGQVLGDDGTAANDSYV